MYEKKMDSMRQTFELVKKNIKQASIDYSVGYFSEKSTELGRLFTNEVLKLLRQYTLVKEDSATKDAMLSKVIKVIG